MLVKLSSRNRLTIPKAIMRTLGAVQGFAVALHDGKIFLNPACLQRAREDRKNQIKWRRHDARFVLPSKWESKRWRE